MCIRASDFGPHTRQFPLQRVYDSHVFDRTRPTDAPAREAAAERSLLDLDELSLLLARLGGVIGFSFLTALGAQLSIPLPPYGVPQTLQTLVVLLAALCLGPRLGLASMAFYLAAGVIGVPMYAKGDAGLQVILGQTGGYIVGFMLCQPVVSLIAVRRDKTARGWGAMIAAVLAGHAVIFAIGVPWLWLVRNTDPDTAASFANAVYGGCVIFIPGMILKSIIAVIIGRYAAPYAARRFW